MKSIIDKLKIDEQIKDPSEDVIDCKQLDFEYPQADPDR